MRIYFPEITYNNLPVVWEVFDTENIALAIGVYDQIENKVKSMPLYPSADKLNNRNSIRITESQFSILSVTRFIEKHALHPQKFKEDVTDESIKNGFEKKTLSESDYIPPSTPKPASIRGSRTTSLTFIPFKGLQTSHSASNLAVQTNFSISFDKIVQSETLKGKIGCYESLPENNRAEILALKENPIISLTVLECIRKLEWGCKAATLRKERLNILRDMIDNYIADAIKKMEVNNDDFKRLNKQITEMIADACSNEDLELCLPHHKPRYNNPDVSKMRKERQRLVEMSQQLEVQVATANVCDFALKNLPDVLKNGLETNGLAESYNKVYRELIENELKTGKQLRENNKAIENLQAHITNKDFCDPEFQTISNIIDRLIPTTVTKNKASKNYIFFKSSAKTLHYSSAEHKVMLADKIRQALKEAIKNADNKSKIKSGYYEIRENEHVFIKNEFVPNFQNLLKTELKITDEEEIGKQLLKRITLLNTKDLVSSFCTLLDDWFRDHQEESKKNVPSN